MRCDQGYPGRTGRTVDPVDQVDGVDQYLPQFSIAHVNLQTSNFKLHPSNFKLHTSYVYLTLRNSGWKNAGSSESTRSRPARVSSTPFSPMVNQP